MVSMITSWHALAIAQTASFD